MNRQQFFQWINDPFTLNADSAGDLEELILNYPYFQTARMLNLINLKLLKDYRFEQELRRVAALSADRSRLRDWLELLDNVPDQPARKNVPDVAEPPIIADREKDIHLKQLEDQIKASLKEIEIRKSRLRELIEEKKAIVVETGREEEELADKGSDLPFRPLPRDPILDEFIRQNEDQSTGRVSFYNSEESAKKSIEDNDDFISETLARLVAAQGKKDKAIKIYQKLMLKYPQKSSYFAAQIEKLRKES